MLWLSTKRSICHFNCATFRLPRVRSLHCPSKNFFFFFNANPLDRQHSQQVHGKRKGAQIYFGLSKVAQHFRLYQVALQRIALHFAKKDKHFCIPFVLLRFRKIKTVCFSFLQNESNEFNSILKFTFIRVKYSKDDYIYTYKI